MTNESSIPSEEKLDCPLLGRLIDRGLCMDINLQRVGAMTMDDVKQIMRQKNCSLEVISNICENCKYCPLHPTE